MVQKFRIEVQFATFLPGAALRLVNKAEVLIQRITSVLARDYRLDDINVDQTQKKIYLYITELRSPGLPLAAIVAAIMPILIAIGVIIIAITAFNVTRAVVEYKEVKTKSDLTRDLINAGVNPDQVSDILAGVQPGGLSKDIITIVIVLVAALVALKLFKK